MLRTALLILALGAASAACGPSIGDPAVGIEVRADDGTVLGHVTSVERDSAGRIVAAEIEGLEPADAPEPSTVLAGEDERMWVRT